jgi:hypothetical protein
MGRKKAMWKELFYLNEHQGDLFILPHYIPAGQISFR